METYLINGVTFLSLYPDHTLVFDNDIVHKPSKILADMEKQNRKKSEAVILIRSNGCSGLTFEKAHFHKN